MAKHRKFKAATRKNRKHKNTHKPEHRSDSVALVQATNLPTQEVSAHSDVSAAPFHKFEQARRFAQVHSEILGLAAYHRVCFGIMDPGGQRAQSGLTDDQFVVGLAGVLDEFGQAMKPRDPLEKLALEQMLVHHAKVLAMSKQASASSTPSVTKILNEGCDAAASSFRRLMTAFRDHRQPKNSGTSVSIANMTQQQIVEVKQNGLEQTRIHPIDEGAAPTLPPHGGGFEIVTRRNQPPAPVEIEHGPAHTRREGSGGKKRTQARLPVRRGRRAAKAGGPND